MRLVSLREDSDVFCHTVNRTLFMLFRDKRDDFLCMIKEQTPVFWLGFTIALHDVLERKDFMVMPFRQKTNFADRFFIFLHDMLIENKPESIATYINDVVTVARYSKFINCLEACVFPDIEMSVESEGMASFERLFGDRKENDIIDKVCSSHILHLRAVGGLLVTFHQWLTAKKSNGIDWVMPSAWYTDDSLQPFYAHLKKRWGQSLLTMLPIHSSISWWKHNSVVEFSRYQKCVGLTFQRQSPDLYQSLELNNINSKMILWNSNCNHILNYKYHCFVSMVTVRDLYASQDYVVFHPYAQLAACVFAKAVGPWLWASADGVKSKFRDDVSARELSFRRAVAKAIEIHEEVNEAMQLDASFHDSVSCGTNWTSPETLARLLVNMPLCIKWLEWLLVQTYSFESVFLPFCHFPVRKKFATVMERMQTLLSHEPRLLVKAAIIIAEHILVDEADEKTVDRNSRALLRFCLERLVPKMKFFNNGRCYKLLKFVLEGAWKSEEQLSGLMNRSAQKDSCRTLHNGSTADINMDLCFSNNYRSVSYWFNFKEPQTLEFSKEQYVKACSKITEYKKAVNEHQDAGNKEKNELLKCDKLYYQKFRNAPQSEDICAPDLSTKNLIASAVAVFDSGFLLDAVFTCFFIYTNSQPDSMLRMPGVEFLQLINHSSYSRNIITLPAADSQDMLGLLHTMEWKMVMMDIMGRVSAAVHSMVNKRTACPAPKFFSDAYVHIAAFSGEAADFTSLEQANAVLSKLDCEDLFIDSVQFGEPEKIEDWSVLVDPVEELESRHVKLLQAVARVQYHKIDEECCRYSLLSELEYRFVEELASLRKSREMGRGDVVQRLVPLLSFRYNRMVSAYKQWETKPQQKKLPRFDSLTDLYDAACNLKAKLMAIFVQLRSTFSAYLSPQLTMHPVSETSECLLLRLADVLIKSGKIISRADGTTHLLAALMSTGLSYLETLLDDCMKVWRIPKLYTSPTNIPADVAQHAELMQVAFTHMLLYLANGLPKGWCSSSSSSSVSPFLVSPRGLLPHIEEFFQIRHLLAGFVMLVKAGTLVRQAALQSREDVLGKTAQLYRCASMHLAPLVEIIRGSKLGSVDWQDCSKEWMKCIQIATKGGSLSSFLNIIHHNEFLSKADALLKQSVADRKGKSDCNFKKSSNQQTSTVGSLEEKIGGCVMKDATIISKVGTTGYKETVCSAYTQQEAKVVKEGRSNAGNYQNRQQKKGHKGNGGKFSTKSTLVNGNTLSTSDVVTRLQNLHLNICFGCQRTERNPHMFMKCKLCVTEKWSVIRFYCSSECRVADWERRHDKEHSIGERESDYSGDGLDID